MEISALHMDFKELNEQIKQTPGDVRITGCFGQRFIGAAAKGRKITIDGTPGNALGAYLNGAQITVNGNAQDATGDTMNDGLIIINGSAGDALGYAMRGGRVFVKGASGYRTGIHMKEYKDKKPVIVIGGRAGSFLGEYLAGGVIIVLGLNETDIPVGNFTGTGMHGGRIYIRTDKELQNLPVQVIEDTATDDDMQDIMPYLTEFAQYFNIDIEDITNKSFFCLKPNAKNPYKQMYTAN